jgi:hypothetical protein
MASSTLMTMGTYPALTFKNGQAEAEELKLVKCLTATPCCFTYLPTLGLLVHEVFFSCGERLSPTLKHTLNKRRTGEKWRRMNC